MLDLTPISTEVEQYVIGSKESKGDNFGSEVIDGTIIVHKVSTAEAEEREHGDADKVTAKTWVVVTVRQALPLSSRLMMAYTRPGARSQLRHLILACSKSVIYRSHPCSRARKCRQFRLVH